MTDQHAVILNRNREASMILPGECLLLVEMVPALFAAFAANEAEKVAPKLTLVDCQMIGATGRVFVSGTRADAERAKAHILASARGDRGAGEIGPGRRVLTRRPLRPALFVRSDPGNRAEPVRVRQEFLQLR